MARVRERRCRALVDELLPKVRRLNPTMPDDQVLEMAESMADLRLLAWLWQRQQLPRRSRLVSDGHARRAY